MKLFFRVGFSFALLSAVAQAAGAKGAAAQAPAKSERSNFVFSLLPKALQRNPRLEFNIVTEMTPEGRKLRAPTAQSPTYYVAQAGGMFNGGAGADKNVKSPPPERLQQMMVKALAESGYVPGDEGVHAPTLAIVYVWGSHNFQPPEQVAGDPVDPDVPYVPVGMSETEIRKTLLDRAMLLGGAKFAREVSLAMEKVDQKAAMQRTATATQPADFQGSVADGLQDPFDELRARGHDMERLVDELFSSSFFVVASAYDYAALAKGQRRLMWRTKLTVNSLGVNMTESVPPLIASAGPYFGHETKDPVVITKRVLKDGSVEVGPLTVVPDSAPAKAEKPAK